MTFELKREIISFFLNYTVHILLLVMMVMMMMDDNDYLRQMMIPMMTRNIWSMLSAALVFHSSRPFAVNSRRSIASVRFVKSVDILRPAQLLFSPGIILRYIYNNCLPGFALRFIKNAGTWFDGHDPHILTFSTLWLHD